MRLISTVWRVAVNENKWCAVQRGVESDRGEGRTCFLVDYFTNILSSARGLEGCRVVCVYMYVLQESARGERGR